MPVFACEKLEKYCGAKDSGRGSENIFYASPRRTRRAVAPDVWHHRLKADGPSLRAVRKRQGEKIIFG